MTKSLLPESFCYSIFTMIPIVACELICDMNDLDLASESKQTVTSKHKEPILTGCYNNH
jgi:hypothetical protein